MRTLSLCLCWLLWLGAALPAAAAPARTLRFEQLNVEQGLAQESVLAMAQDGQGFIWLGSQAGLSRYDGYRVVTYKNAVADPRTLVDNWVRALFVDRRGRLWVGTDGGLDRFDPDSQTFQHYRPAESAERGNGNRHVRAIVDDGAGGLWLATGDGLQHLDPDSGRFTLWHHDPADPASLVDDQVTALARDGAGQLWIGTAKGLDLLTPGARRLRHYQPDAAPNSKYNGVMSLLVDASQRLWIGSRGGVEQWRFEDGVPRRRRMGAAEGFSGGHAAVLQQDADGAVWVGSSVDGLYRWTPSSGTFVRYAHQAGDSHSVAGNQIAALFLDRFGTFWVGTWYNGASRVDLASGGFARLVSLSGAGGAPSDNLVRALADDGQGGVWVGGNGGLSRYDPVSGKVSPYRAGPGRPFSVGGHVSAIWRAADGALWLGGASGLRQFDPAGRLLASVSFARGDADSDRVRAIAADRAGALWVSTRSGLHRLDPHSRAFQTFRHDPADPDSLADNVVRPVLEDRAGGLWVGTFNGLDLLDRKSGRFRHFRHDPNDPGSLSHDEVHALFEDRHGRLWVGTASGLNLMRRGADGAPRFQRYTRRDGLGDDAVAAILADDSDGLWLSTNSGIAYLDARSGRFRNYGASDGTIEGSYLDGVALRAPDGVLYFGGFNGVTAFAPAAIRDNQLAPAVAITDFQVFNQSLRPGGGLARAIESTPALTLSERDSVFSLEFAALHYAAPQRNRYAYQLEGFDQDWVRTDAGKRFATYTNLDPGRYRFRVKAANKDGVWNEPGATLEITILPRFWRSWWFRALACVLVAGAGCAAYQARIRGMRRRSAQLELQVELRTREGKLQNLQLQRQADELERRRREAEAQRLDAEQRRLEAERQKQEVERQKEKVEQAHRDISVLSEIGREMTATLDVEKAMGTVYHHVHQLMDASRFGIGFYREEQGAIEFPFSMAHGVRGAPYRRLLDEPRQFAVWCLLHKREIVINDFYADYPQYLDGEDSSALPIARLVDGPPGAVAQSMLYTPMLLNGRVVGVLWVQSLARRAYRPVHLSMLQTLAAHAAVGLDNARAYQQLEAALAALGAAQAQLVQREKQVSLRTDELALANDALNQAWRKAEEATRQKSEFLANMSHEMRTPLAGVIGMLGFALRDGGLAAATREQILRGQANARSLLAIINDLLDFSKIEAGKVSLEHIDFSLGALIDNVASLFGEQAGGAVAFRIEAGDDLPAFVRGDPTRLRQVLVNLVGNAFKFTQRGSVRLRAGLAGRDGDGRHRVRFTVEDTGIGIPAEAMPRLFQKFEQADSSTTRRYGGTGLGLAICRQLVELMGGEIGAASQPGRGSAFTVLLPLAEGREPARAPQLPRAPHSHRLRVLCAEDFPTNQIIIRTMLEELGHAVDLADNGALAVAACAARRYDLILMDGRMPELDGASATRLIRAGGPPEAPVRDARVMIVALTANVSEEDRGRYLAAGMDDFLTKPIDEAALHAQLARAVERQLQRGVALAPMAAPPVSALDAMFGVAPAGAGRSSAAAAAPADARGDDLRRRLRAAFAGDVPARLAELDAALAARDSETAGRLLHGIKGSAAYLGADALQRLADELEVAAGAAAWPALTAALPRLRALLDAVVAAP